MPSTTIPRGNILLNFAIGPTLTPASVAANTTAEQTFTIAGLQVGDFMNVYSASAQTAGIGIVSARVSAANTLAIGFSNNTAGSLTPVSGIYNVEVNRPEYYPLPVSAV